MKTISLPGRGGNESTIYVLIVCKGSFHRINILIFNHFFKIPKIINILKVRKKNQPPIHSLKLGQNNQKSASNCISNDAEFNFLSEKYNLLPLSSTLHPIATKIITGQRGFIDVRTRAEIRVESRSTLPLPSIYHLFGEFEKKEYTLSGPELEHVLNSNTATFCQITFFLEEITF